MYLRFCVGIQVYPFRCIKFVGWYSACGTSAHRFNLQLFARVVTSSRVKKKLTRTSEFMFNSCITNNFVKTMKTKMFA